MEAMTEYAQVNTVLLVLLMLGCGGVELCSIARVSTVAACMLSTVDSSLHLLIQPLL